MTGSPASREAEKHADEDERRVLAAKLKALGVKDHGVHVEVDGYRYRERAETIAVGRKALMRLIGIAEQSQRDERFDEERARA